METNQTINPLIQSSDQVSTPVANQAATLQTNQASANTTSTQTNQLSTEEIKPPMVAKVMSVYFWILALLSLVPIILSPMLVLILNQSTKSALSASLDFELVKSLPYYFLAAPLAGIGSFVAYAYAASYIKTGSQKAWLRALLIMIFAPIVVFISSLVVYLGLFQINNYVGTF